MEIKMNATRTAVLEVLRNATTPMTLDQIASAMGVDKVATGTTNAMITAGYIAKAGEAEIIKPATVNRTTYTYVGEPTDAKFEMNDKRRAIANALNGKELTLEQVGDIVGFKVASGTTNAMVSKGVIAKVGVAKVPTTKKSKVATYTIGDNAPKAE